LPRNTFVTVGLTSKVSKFDRDWKQVDPDFYRIEMGSTLLYEETIFQELDDGLLDSIEIVERLHRAQGVNIVLGIFS
jgi:hypothetical protein